MSNDTIVSLSVIINELNSDDSDNDFMLLISKDIYKTKKKKRRVCIENYIEIVAKYYLQYFRCHFRLSKATFEVLLSKIGVKLNTEPHKKGRPSNDATVQLLVSVWFLLNQECYRTVADRFNITVSTGWSYFRKTIHALLSIVQEIIKWPETQYERQQISQMFYEKQGIEGVLGAIDGTHVHITAPHLMPNSYLNRKRYHSIILQAVCTDEYKFIDCYTGCTGSMHDARVLRHSPLGKKLISNHYTVVPPKYHLLGDSAYPNMRNLVTPYKDNGRLTQIQKHFNYKHSSTRVAIENSFGLLKGRFRILRFLNVYDTSIIPKIILSCCILHNMCIALNDMDVKHYIDEEREIIEVVLQDGNRDGSAKRDILAAQLGQIQ